MTKASISNPSKDLTSRSKFYKYLDIFTYRSYSIFGKEYFCDVCLVKEKGSQKTFVRLIKRWFGLSKKMKEAGEKEHRWIIINSYNFTQKFEFKRVKQIFNKIDKKEIKEINKNVDVDNANILVKEVKKLKQKINTIQKKKRKSVNDKQTITELKKKVKLLDFENRSLKKTTLKYLIPEFRNALKQIQSKLDTKGESYFQKQFSENDWIFGQNYEEVIPKKKADTENQPDFVLKRYDGFSDVVEIEKPSKPLFTKPNKSGKSRQTAYLSEAIAQAMDYIDSYNSNYRKIYYDSSTKGDSNPIHAYYPKGIVVIGRNKNTNSKKLRQLNNFLHNIHVLTYDEFLKQSSRMLDMLEKS